MRQGCMTEVEGEKDTQRERAKEKQRKNKKIKKERKCVNYNVRDR